MGHIVLLDLHVPCFYLDHFAKKHLWHLVSERQDHEKSRTLRQDISCCQWCFPYTKTILQRTHVELSTLCRWDVERNGCSESSLCSRKVKSLYKQRSLFLLVTSVLRPCFLCVILCSPSGTSQQSLMRPSFIICKATFQCALVSSCFHPFLHQPYASHHLTSFFLPLHQYSPVLTLSSTGKLSPSESGNTWR